MKILVTGGAGFIGVNLIERLIKEGHDVHSLDNYTTGTDKNHLPTVQYYKGDVSEHGSFDWFLAEDYDIIYHLAAQSRVQPSFEDPSETFTSNVLGTKRVCEFALKIGAKVVYAGSSSKHHNPATSPYAMLYGPGEALDEVNGNVIGIWRSRVERGADIEIVGDGEQRRDFTHVEDIVDGLYKIGTKNIEHHDAWELGTGVNYSINELGKMFQNKFNCEISYLEDQPGNYRATLCESEDAIELLGWKPKDQLLYYINNLD